MAQHPTSPQFDLGKILGSIKGLGGGSTASSSTSSSSVSVNPVISVINGGGGSPTFSTSGQAQSNPVANATAQPRPAYRSGYGLGSGVLPLDSAGDLPPEITGGGVLDDFDLGTAALAAAGAALAWFTFKG